MNGGAPEIGRNGAYAVLDLWTWRGWLEALLFLIFFESLKEFIFGTVIAVGFGFVYLMSPDMPMCVAGDIVYSIPFSDEKIDICTELGLDTTVIWDETTTLPTGHPFRIRIEVESATELFALHIR